MSRLPILMMRQRKNCPICGVETYGGNACRYHKRRQQYHERTARERRVRYWVQELGELIDEARRA